MDGSQNHLVLEHGNLAKVATPHGGTSGSLIQSNQTKNSQELISVFSSDKAEARARKERKKERDTRLPLSGGHLV